MTRSDPEVTACLDRHTGTPVAHCADCGICEDCDVTLGQQETPDEELCEVCANAADARRLEDLLTGPAPKPRPTTRPASITRAKLDETAVRMLRRRAERGETVRELATELGLNRHTVGDAVAGRSWRHV